MKRLTAYSLCGLLAASAAYAANLNVLVLIGDVREQETPILDTLTSVADHNFTYEKVVIEGGSFDGDMRGADILYFPWNGPGHDGGYLMQGSEDSVSSWVEAGGMVWISAFDDNFTDADGAQVGGWLPSSVTVENTGDSDIDTTADGDASGLFSNPNAVDLNAMTLDDNFANLDAAWTIYATRVDNGSPAVCSLEHGSGLYLEACIDTRDAGRGATAAPLMENGLFFLAERIANSTAVDAQGKITTAWAALKR